MVVEEAARLSHQYGQRWTMASALTPKVPAQSDVSPPDAQTHRLSNGKRGLACPMSERTCPIYHGFWKRGLFSSIFVYRPETLGKSGGLKRGLSFETDDL